MDGYINTKEAAELWGISPRQVQKLCNEGRVQGAVQFLTVWVIPKDASKPTRTAKSKPGPRLGVKKAASASEANDMRMRSIQNIGILDANDFTFAPFVSKAGGDSGTLFLATSKSDPQLQYVIKSGFVEIACNEFIYHHVASALGLYTQEARLFKGVSGSKCAVGIRYVPNARKFALAEATEEDKQIFYKFKSLYIILNEDDSEELHYDEQGRLFKLDNASSFNLGTGAVEGAIRFESKGLPDYVSQLFANSANYIEYEKYGIALGVMYEHFGRSALETMYNFYKQFSDFDLAWLQPAAEILDKIYPWAVVEHYAAFIEKRIEACKQFITENTAEQFMSEGEGGGRK